MCHHTIRYLPSHSVWRRAPSFVSPAYARAVCLRFSALGAPIFYILPLPLDIKGSCGRHVVSLLMKRFRRSSFFSLADLLSTSRLIPNLSLLLLFRVYDNQTFFSRGNNLNCAFILPLPTATTSTICSCASCWDGNWHAPKLSHHARLGVRDAADA